MNYTGDDGQQIPSIVGTKFRHPLCLHKTEYASSWSTLI